MRERDKLDLIVENMAEELRPRMGPHPSTEELLAHQQGELAKSAQQEVGQHLALCRECQIFLLALPRFEVQDNELQREGLMASMRAKLAWWRFQRLVAGDSRPRRPEGRRAWTVATVAAGIAVVAFLGLQNTSLRDELHRKNRELELVKEQFERQVDGEANAAYLELSPVSNSMTVRSPEQEPDPKSVRVTAGGGLFLILNAGSSRDDEDLEIVIETLAGEPIFRRGGLRPRGVYGQFTVQLPGRLVRPGSYSIDLFGTAGKERRPIVTFTFNVEQ